MNSYENLLKSTSLIFGFYLGADGKGHTLDDTSAAALPVWIHLDYSSADCVSNLVELGIPEAAIDGLVRIDTRPRSLLIRGGMLLILRGVNLNPGDNPEDMVSLRFWLEGNRLVTIRQRRVMSTQDVRLDLEQGNGPSNIQDLLFAIIEGLASRIADYVDDLEEQISTYENSVDTGDAAALRTEVSVVRRKAAAVRRYLAPQRDALESFYRQAKDFLDENHALFIHEQSDRIMRYIEDLDLIREKALVLQEELMNRIAQEQNSRMYVLSLVAAIFLPITFVTGLFGMNVAGLPGINEPRAFIFVVMFMLVMMVGTIVWFRRKRWL